MLLSRDKLLSVLNSKSRVLIVGLGISGIESALFFRRFGTEVVCVEKRAENDYLSTKFAERLPELKSKGVEVQFGIDGEKVSPFLAEVKLGVLSPGVSTESSICGALRRRNIPLVSELELGLTVLGWPALIVTGSNGKSTTVNLVHSMLKAEGYDTKLCGNIGVPLVTYLSPHSINVEIPRRSYLVVEASSYQLETSVVAPHVGVLLNVSDNHLERHGTLERYLAAKAKLFSHQGRGDFALLNADDGPVAALASKLPARTLYFGCKVDLERDQIGARIEYHPREAVDRVRIRIGNALEDYDIEGSRLLGLHNRYDIAAAALTARLVDVTPESIREVIANFEPLEHRLELVRSINSGQVINDSKSTTVAASQAGIAAILEAYPHAKIILMLGGLSKAGSWEPLMRQISNERERFKSIICFGQDAKLIASHCQAHGISPLTSSKLKDATATGLKDLNAGEILLLSPGCASFDEFNDFEERGKMFKAWVNEAS